jgi:hypothetical protein
MGLPVERVACGRTRLVIGGYEVIRPRWLGRLYSFIPAVWIMQARMLAAPLLKLRQP